MSEQFPPCPPQFKVLQHYLKVAAEHDQRDPVISYWCRLYTLQQAMKIDKKSPDAVKLLMALMDWLEKQKSIHKDNEAISTEIAAQSHVENYALKLFLWADGQDRAGIFNKNVVKAFYTAGMLFDVMDTFGEPSENLLQNKKYAKWKASYIHNCLKNGETPIPGPEGGEDDGEEEGAFGGSEGAGGSSSHMGFVHPSDGFPNQPPSNFDPSSGHQFPGYNPPNSAAPTPTGGLPDVPTGLPDVPSGLPNVPAGLPSVPGFTPQPSPQHPGVPMMPASPMPAPSVPAPSGGVALMPEQITKAQKYCKWASSALNYDDVPTAITNLQKALNLLQTGQDC